MTETEKLLKKEAENGNKDAQYDLGLAYEHGNGVEKNEKKAFSTYKKYAQKGNYLCMQALGICYRYGIGTHKNRYEAERCLFGAARQDYEVAQYELANLYAEGSSVYDEVMAFKYYKLAALNHFPAAENCVAQCYYYGKGVTQNQAIAKLWFLEAVKHEEPNAMYNLAWIVKQEGDAEYAFRLYEQGASLDDVDCILKVAECHAKGIGTPQNGIEAMHYYKRAEELGHKGNGYVDEASDLEDLPVVKLDPSWEDFLKELLEEDDGD